jgi:hypothetical protein
MTRVGFETTIPVFEQVKTVDALDREATVIGEVKYLLYEPERVFTLCRQPHGIKVLRNKSEFPLALWLPKMCKK